MDINTYQQEAAATIQQNAAQDGEIGIVPFLGIIGEVGSVVTQIKRKIRDGASYVAYDENLKEELGDVLWYIAAIATQNNLKLEDVAGANLNKIRDRFLEMDSSDYPDFDRLYPENEQFPDEFEIEFVPSENDGKKQLTIIDKRTGKQLGGTLTDNTYEDDGYRFHDVFHYTYLAILGWSPVLRKLLEIKRKSDSTIDENEDGARACITEELVALFIYHHAVEHNLLKYSKSVDSAIIKEVQQLVKNTEAKACSGKQWEKAILASYEIFNTLRENNGGRVLVSKKNRTILYLGKK